MNLITVEGKFGIKATVLAYSINQAGDTLLTYEIEYQRIVLAEYNTHCMLGRNSSSSRAIPFEKMKKQLTGRPVRFGAANAGMQDKGEHNATIPFYMTNTRLVEMSPEQLWDHAKEEMLDIAQAYHDAGYAKQVYNRLTETFQMMKTVTTATEWENFFWLRDHDAADPTLRELARCMSEARDKAIPEMLHPGEWHLPYIFTKRTPDGNRRYFLSEEGFWNGEDALSLEEAKVVSVARTAAVSFRNEDYGVVKSEEVYDRLISGDRKHASSFEHAGTPMKESCSDPMLNIHVNVCDNPMTWEEGVTHMDRAGNLWSAKFLGWIQLRKLIPNENYTGE